MNDGELNIAGKTFSSRFLLGTGKFRNKPELKASIQASGAEIVTVALRRIDLERHEENILEYIPQGITLLTNTSGARSADEAVRLARLARAAGHGDWIKIEVINDSKYLLPDNEETIKATQILCAEGFIVLPYVSPDLYVARRLVQAGAAAIMPLGSFIGSNMGLRTREFIAVLIAEINVPIIVDAGIGAPSHACEAMEMGASAVLVNTAVAVCGNPPAMTKAFAQAIDAGRAGFLSGLPAKRPQGEASSPLTGFLFE
ncbi:MAG: thiazole synthase [Candidatus Omnitrophica bacterium]|nr:thiazole synthase [Candidatus Omnitrophota bacterium]